MPKYVTAPEYDFDVCTEKQRRLMTDLQITLNRCCLKVYFFVSVLMYMLCISACSFVSQKKIGLETSVFLLQLSINGSPLSC